MNNIGRRIAPGTVAKREFMAPYKFNIAFENGSTPGYTTEKIVEAMWARNLPIYWGNPRIAKEFNPRSFLNYFDFPSEDALVEKIIELDRDDPKYMEYLRDRASPTMFPMSFAPPSGSRISSRKSSPLPSSR